MSKNISENFKLIHGSFNAKDAKEILFNVFNSKINFHKHKNFMSLERTGVQDTFSMERQNQLIAVYSKIEKILSEVDIQGGKLHIEGDIQIFFGD
jgi:hypothetical protein